MFGNARTAWLAALRGTAHWAGIERFVRVVITASEVNSSIPQHWARLLVCSI
jgi:hypothetical protein